MPKKKINIIELTASFSMKKNLENYENADLFFSAKAEVGSKDKPEQVAEQVYTFVKTLAVNKYNSFSRKDLEEKKLTLAEETLSEEQVDKIFESGRQEGYKAGAKKAVEMYKLTGKTLDEIAAEKGKEEKGEPGDGYKQTSEK